MEKVAAYLPAMLGGLWITVLVAGLSILGCAVVSVALGVLRTVRRSPARLVSGAVIELVRGGSVIIYLFWVYYALPVIPGAPQLSPLVAAVLVLSLGGGAYGAEIVRGGIEAVPRGQLEACQALGLSRFHALALVVLPQALSQIVPGFASLAVDMVKWTSIVSFVGVQDVFYAANTARAVTNETVLVYLLLVLAYFVLCFAASLLFRAVELALPLSRAARAGRGLADAGFFRAPASAEPMAS